MRLVAEKEGGAPSVTAENLIVYLHCARRNLQTLAVIQEAIANDDLSTAKEAWEELSEAEMQTLWRAPTKGSLFSTKEREIMKSTEWHNA